MSSNPIRSASDFREFVFNSVFEDVDLTTGYPSGEGAHVGIVDSVHQPPQWVQSDFDVYSKDPFVETDSDTFDIEHGMQVFDILSRIVPNATFSFYQAVGEDRHTDVAPFSDAIDKAIQDDVDILNLSIGAPNQIPAKCSPYYPPIKRAIDNGIVPVAASGNLEYPDGPKKYVYAPANIQPVVAVGGSETLCPDPKTSDAKITHNGPYFSQDDPRERHYCSQNSCSDGEPCIRKKSTRPYPNNTKLLDGKPDVLAPAHFPSLSGTDAAEDVDLHRGTSYAAPIVAGLLARMVSEHELDGDLLEHLPDLLSESGKSIEDYPAPKLNAFNFQNRLSSELEKQTTQNR